MKIIDNDKKYLLSSVYNTLEILDLLSNYKELSLAEITRKSGFGKTSVFKMLYTLEKKEFITKTPDANYKLGIKFAHYGTFVVESQEDLTIIKPFLQELRDKHNETVHLSILNNELNIVFLAKETGNATIQMYSRIGAELPAYCTGTGKVLLASKLDDDLKEKIYSLDLRKKTDNTITDPDNLLKELEKIKVKGYGEDLGESEIGLTCYAAPVKDISGETIYAISVSGPTNRMMAKKDELIPSIIYYGDQISRELGYKD